MPRSAASLQRLARPGRRCRCRLATYSAVAGTPARSASTTGLRPDDQLAAPPLARARRRGRRRRAGAGLPTRLRDPCAPRRVAALAARRGRRARSRSARPSASGPCPRRPLAAVCPPEPTVGPFFVRRLAAAPSRWPLLPGHRWHRRRSRRVERPARRRAGCPRRRPGGVELVADRVGGGEVLARRAAAARCSSASRDQRVDDAAQVVAARRRRRPTAGRAGRGRARRASPGPRPGGRAARPCRPRPARCCPRGRCRARRRAPAGRRGRRPSPRRTPAAPGRSARRRPAEQLGRPAARSPRSARTPPRPPRSASSRVLDHRAVVRGAEVVAQHDGRTRSTTSMTSSELPSDLLIFSPPMVTSALCIQYRANAVAGRRATGRSRSRGAGRSGRARRRGCRTRRRGTCAAIAEHSRCQPGRPRPHGRRPARRLARLGALPQREVARVALAARRRRRRRLPCRRAAGRTARRTPASERTSK